jgi:hypothetical protein
LFDPYCDALGVGSETEDALAEVRGADGGRGDNVPLRSPPARGKRPEYSGESFGEEADHVLHEEEARSYLANDAPDVFPDPAFVVELTSESGLTERLARHAGHDNIHAVAKRDAVEGLEIVPDKMRIQRRVFHPGHQHGRGVGLPLTSENSTESPSQARHGAGDAELKAPDPGAEAEDGAGRFGTWSHVIAIPAA